jgi:hypothetical protein
MSERFDSLSKAMAGPMPRRGALRLVGATIAAGAAAVVVRPFRSDALDGCGPGRQDCGPGCCPPKTYCVRVSAGVGCCCPNGTSPCGGNCCKAGVACADRLRGRCGCQPGTTPCGNARDLTCCPAGVACTPSSSCPPPLGTNVLSSCHAAASDVNVKENVVPVGWDAG